MVQRYVRAASPANGTKLASGNFDLFLSGLLTLIGQVPFFFGSPFYAAFKRVVIEIAKNRTKAHLVPGIEAMLPDSPIARLLRDAPVRPGMAMAVIAGDIEGGNLLVRLGVLLTDFLLFERDDNDLVVNTPAMLAGIAPRADARVLFDRGADVSHFRYFANVGTRSALRDWLVRADPSAIEAFQPLPDPADYAAALAAAARDVLATDRPVVVILPGVMGSHLQVGGKDRVWFDPLDIASGGLAKIAWGKPGVEAEDLFGMFYGELCKTLADSHRVERFAYDWRQPLDVLGERFGEFIDRLMKQTQQPIRLLAHSMGGLVVRACIHQRRPVMDALMARDGARLVMLGTPHQGAHSMVENLLGKGDTLRTLVRLDVTHSMQQVLDIVAGFRGALQLLPRPGFKDMFQGQSDGGGVLRLPEGADLDRLRAQGARLLVRQRPGRQAERSTCSMRPPGCGRRTARPRPSLPADYETQEQLRLRRGRATRPAACARKAGRLRMVGTAHGDGTVTWASGRIGGIGQFFYMPAAHGDLPSTKEHFPALVELLTTGTTGRLATVPPAVRAIEAPQPVSYDAGPPSADDPDMLGRSLLGGSLRNRMPGAAQAPARGARAGQGPALPGAADPGRPVRARPDRRPAAADRQRAARRRPEPAPQPGPVRRPAGHRRCVVLRAPNEVERARGSLRGAVVTGLGPYDGGLSVSSLTEAVRAGALRYLLQLVDVLGKDEREVSLATLLLGYNSSANLSVEASIEALVRGVMEANARFFETTRLNIRIGRLDIVELYIDTAITAVYSLRRMEGRLAARGRAVADAAGVQPGAGARRRPAPAAVRRRRRQLLAAPDRHRGRSASRSRRRRPTQAPATVLADSAEVPLPRPARARRVAAAPAPARADRAPGAPADPQHRVERGLRPHAVPADGAARLQGPGAPARAGGAGGRRDHRQPAVGADAGRRPVARPTATSARWRCAWPRCASSARRSTAARCARTSSAARWSSATRPRKGFKEAFSTDDDAVRRAIRPTCPAPRPRPRRWRRCWRRWATR